MTKPRHRPLSRRLAVGALSAAALALLTGWAPATLWSAKVTVSPIGAHIIGNPAAKVRLVEYFSYTCNHCGDFAKAAAAPLKTQYIDKGLVAVEYRNLIRDPFDLTAALLARCGTAQAFPGNHQAIFAAQSAWLTRIEESTKAQQARWSEGGIGERMRRIAADTGLTALMQKRGYDAARIDACIDSEVAQAEVIGMTNIAHNTDKVRGTPSFFINGVDTGVHDWPSLKTRLDLAINGS
ncbi:MAG: protein-disulfide isomerase [Alphaproteobacteria bacterium HGW-Alphaproteobacteria-13]|jgi:protein-disulfide isomerase|nr:MAG: protein-disulfide isomerase [Alphaproteobacteria bacterium HGW-Alphaproteobacteria-13]